MKIIIIGSGKVGFTLAKQLSGENHDLVLIDQRAEAMQVADNTLDILCLEGSGASIQILLEAGVRSAGAGSSRRPAGRPSRSRHR